VTGIVQDVDEIKVGTRVQSGDYGDGTVVTVMGNQIQVFWDNELVGTNQHLLSHDRSYVERLDRL
jgi:hypothetical protein